MSASGQKKMSVKEIFFLSLKLCFFVEKRKWTRAPGRGTLFLDCSSRCYRDIPPPGPSPLFISAAITETWLRKMREDKARPLVSKDLFTPIAVLVVWFMDVSLNSLLEPVLAHISIVILLTCLQVIWHEISGFMHFLISIKRCFVECLCWLCVCVWPLSSH